MLRTSENETEILLGNKQLLGIFFVVAILLGVAFTGGYMVGRGPAAKKTAAVTVPSSGTESTDTAATGNAPGGETHSVEPQGSSVAPDDASANGTSTPAQEEPLGSRKHHKSDATQAAPQTARNESAAEFAPQAGQEFLQVTAVGHDEALAIADVLHRKGFRAHAVPKPGTKLYRVLIGPIRDAGDLSTTRDSLRKTGFREVIVQRY